MSEATTPALAIPATGPAIARAAAELGITVPEACLPGVAANLALLRSHAIRLLATGDSGSAAGT